MQLNLTTDQTSATHLDRFLARMVADAARELAAENLTEFDRFLAGMVADAADALGAYSPGPVYHVNAAVHGPVDRPMAALIAKYLESAPALTGPAYMRRGTVTPAVDYSGERQFARARRTGLIGGKAPAPAETPAAAALRLALAELQAVPA